ncbi:Rv3654c family TadE-like protein [Nonomuraea soli]|uniref:Secretion/DNA translocation related TadE-like protein n=1 Tax=Nonomuraea soli TaxID=1032476 RepID=A0A7W0CHQ0_9ACTN|nr:Rv3654c family TadE-like protein [Nonomuraea soli]MBA2891364.1 secretion/DNA translocation related TadE-like protein [Nonomuraea soli]
MSPPTADRGSATLWSVALMALLMIAATAITTVGAAHVARHRAQTSADLSALAAAKLAIADPDEACRAAKRIAEANRAALTNCALAAEMVDVDTAVRITLPAIGERIITAHARAGPTRIGPLRP